MTPAKPVDSAAPFIAHRFSGCTVVVTGGASGIGLATARRFVAEGARVWIGDIDEERGTALARDSHGAITFVPTDVRDAAALDLLTQTAHRASGRLDVMVNNAGASGSRATIEEMQAHEWDDTMVLLLRSVAMGIKAASRIMIAAGGGAIVNTASVAGLSAGMAPIAYSVAKAGVIQLTRVAAAELARHSIRVNAVCPGFIATDIFGHALGLAGAERDGLRTLIESHAGNAQAIARAGRPEDIAAAITWLASPDAGFITGTAPLIDGGLLIGPRHSWDPHTPSPVEMLIGPPAGTSSGTGESSVP